MNATEERETEERLRIERNAAAKLTANQTVNHPDARVSVHQVRWEKVDVKIVTIEVRLPC